MYKNVLIKKIKWTSFLFIIFTSSSFALDPETKAAQKVQSILFGAFGTSLCGILLGATFLLAMNGKITWDKFLFIGFCLAGFLASPAIVMLIQGWVG